jgi:hypothetical protein
MTITCQPMDATSGAPAYSAQNERQNMASLYGGGSGVVLGARSGWRVGTPSNILTATSTTWTLVPCAAVINPGAATAQGSYRWSADANVTGTVRAANATYARKDIVYIQVNDSSSGDGSGALTAPPTYAYGPEDGTNVPPTLPARSFLVGTISVPVLGGGSPTVIVNPAVFVAAGAIQPVYTQAERDALTKYDGLTVRRMDLTGFPLETCRANVWGPEAGAAGLASLTTVTASGGSVTALTVINNIASYTFRGGRKYRITWDLTYQGNTAGNYITALIGTAATTDAAGLTTGVTQINGRPFKIHDTGIDSSGIVNAIYTPSVDATLQIKFLIVVTTGAGTARISASTTQPVTYTIEDLGAQF